jgi:hypothetical protein
MTLACFYGLSAALFYHIIIGRYAINPLFSRNSQEHIMHPSTEGGRIALIGLKPATAMVLHIYVNKFQAGNITMQETV